jgi:hypothetical protein
LPPVSPVIARPVQALSEFLEADLQAVFLAFLGGDVDV